MIDFELYVKTCKALRDSIQSWNESQKQQATEAEKDRLVEIDFPDRDPCFPYSLK